MKLAALVIPLVAAALAAACDERPASPMSPALEKGKP
jgi:hypothetical protein